MAYLRIFSEKSGVQDIPLDQKRLIIGRSADSSDYVIDDKSVSRTHAMVLEEDGVYSIQDLGSTIGTRLNKSRLDGKHNLKDGDTIHLGTVVLEFRSDSSAAPEADLMKTFKDDTALSLLEKFRVPPAGIGLKYRVVYLPPRKVFCSGDTVIIGSGGILVKKPDEPVPLDAFLELEFAWPDGRKKLICGEVIHVVESYNMLCVKLHQLSRERYDKIMGSAQRGCWVVVQKCL